MKKHLKMLLALTLAMMAGGMQAQTQKYDVKIGDFTNLVVLDGINVNYRCNSDSAGTAVFDCDPKIVDGLLFSNNTKGKLTIQVSTDMVGKPDLPTITVYSSYLTEASNMGDSAMHLLKVPAAPQFKVKNGANGKVVVRGLKSEKVELAIVTGRGKIIADGSDCKELKLHNLGTGEIQADQLPATTVSCRLMGTGSIGCNVNGGVLSVRGSGTGKIYYKGTPSNIKKTTLGPIKVLPMENK